MRAHVCMCAGRSFLCGKEARSEKLEHHLRNYKRHDYFYVHSNAKLVFIAVEVALGLVVPTWEVTAGESEGDL